MDSWESKLEGAQKHGQKEKSSVGPRPVRHISLKIAVTLLFFILIKTQKSDFQPILGYLKPPDGTSKIKQPWDLKNFSKKWKNCELKSAGRLIPTRNTL